MLQHEVKVLGQSYPCPVQEQPELVPGEIIDHVLQHVVKVLGQSYSCSVQERPELVPGGTIDHVLQHEVKELGTHILVCDVAYSSPTADKLNFRKFFKFQVREIMN